MNVPLRAWKAVRDFRVVEVLTSSKQFPRVSIATDHSELTVIAVEPRINVIAASI